MALARAIVRCAGEIGTVLALSDRTGRRSVRKRAGGEQESGSERNREKQGFHRCLQKKSLVGMTQKMRNCALQSMPEQ
jgi:hypothetical protein